MRLKPRTLKRKMFTCTECAQCITACGQMMRGKPEGGLLRWVEGEAAGAVVTGRLDKGENFIGQSEGR